MCANRMNVVSNGCVIASSLEKPFQFLQRSFVWLALPFTCGGPSDRRE